MNAAASKFRNLAVILMTTLLSVVAWDRADADITQSSIKAIAPLKGSAIIEEEKKPGLFARLKQKFLPNRDKSENEPAKAIIEVSKGYGSHLSVSLDTRDRNPFSLPNQ